ncbi:uncharacterized protein LOC121430077 [Lytechinus variegatus]|uniref:uncharacterized protein LOC121430077 n=1 Tax=Lytechinus variegatus TaxID=7654 RepID=UPI001BB1C9C0|nr:uncharacterized protein LOC121430077 [Lytechinus variegatus]
MEYSRSTVSMSAVLKLLGVRGPKRLARGRFTYALLISLIFFVTASLFKFQAQEIFITSSYLQTDLIEMNILTQAQSQAIPPVIRSSLQSNPGGVPESRLDGKSGSGDNKSGDLQGHGHSKHGEYLPPLAPWGHHDRTDHAKHRRHHKHHKHKKSKELPFVDIDISKLHFPETETLLKFQSRNFVSHKTDKSHWSPSHDSGLHNGNHEKEAIFVKNVVYPSLLEANNTAPFKAGSCYRQVHLWADEGRSFSRRVGDFPCPGLPCGVRLVVDNDYGTLKSSDAVVLFHRTKLDWAELHRHKPKGQKWIFYTQENPINTDKNVIPQKEFYNTSYDYIMSYRFRESHIYGSYGRYNTDHPEMKFTAMRNWASDKTKQVAWVASNCKLVSWDRKGFVEALSRYIPVSMYGKCGTKPCPRDERCNRSIRKHKFYLALENSPCRDYITEKLWRNAFLNNVVPVVYGASKEDYERVLPPDSFIHVEDFDSIKELASYLRRLSKDEGLYNTYFEWKKFGWVQLTIEEYLLEPEQVCENIVSRLLSDERDMREGTYHRPKFPDWKEWWTNSCKSSVKWPIKLK